MPNKKRPAEPSLRTLLNRVDDVRATLAEIRTTLAEHGSMLVEHGSMLAEHTSVLAEHGTALGDLRLRVDGQSLILEDMRSQNAATIEAVEAVRVSLERRIDRLDEESRARDGVLTARVKGLSRLDKRVSTLERRLT